MIPEVDDLTVEGEDRVQADGRGQLAGNSINLAAQTDHVGAPGKMIQGRMSGIDMNQFRSDVSGFQVREEILKQGSLEVGLIVICRAGEVGADSLQMKPWTPGNLAGVLAGISMADSQPTHPCIDQEMNLDLSTQTAGQFLQLCDPSR